MKVTINGAAGAPRPPRAARRYDQMRCVASPDGMFVKDAHGNNMAVFGVNIALRPGKPPVMQVNLFAQPFDVVATPAFMVQDPASGQVKAAKRIEFWDGSVCEFPEPPSPSIPMTPADKAVADAAAIEAGPSGDKVDG